jgi:hypothetical protein
MIKVMPEKRTDPKDSAQPSPVFIYALVDPRTDRICYVGKSKHPQVRYKEHLRLYGKRSTPTKSWIKSLYALRLFPKLVIIESCAEDRWEAQERHWIAKYREQEGGILNLADGGATPYCPPSLRKELGRATAKRRQFGIWSLLKQFGTFIRDAEKSGKSHKVEKYKNAVAIIRNSKGELRERINAFGVMLYGT